ncbi:MAG: formate--tetrahydrofolate ligase, partial [Patiriisocius sp.]
GGEGAIEVASILIEQLAQPSPKVQMLYEDDTSLLSKIETVATRIYGADGVDLFPSVRRQLEEFEQLGFGHLPVCIAKTQYSFTADSKQVGDIPNHTLPVREVRLAAGAGFVVVVCGEVMTMPGLPRYPAALDIRLDEKGLIEGLF